VEHDVELTHIAKVLVKKLYKQVDGLHQQELVVIDVSSEDEIETRVSPINDFKVLVLDEVGVLLISGDDQSVDLGLHLHTLRLIRRIRVDLGEARLALLVLEEKETNLKRSKRDDNKVISY
jgi:hypothetical protein